MDEEILAYIKRQPVCQQLNDEDFEFFSQLILIEHYEIGQTILLEGDLSRDFYFLLKGELGLFKWDKEKKYQLKIGKLTQDEIFGEMSFLDGEPRASTVKAATLATLLRIPFNALNKGTVRTQSIYNALVQNIAVISIERLRRTNQDYTSSLRSQIDELQLRNNFGYFFMFIIILLGMGITGQTFIQEYGIDPYNRPAEWISFGVMIIPFIALIRKFGYSLDEMGITTLNWRKSLLQGLLISSVLIAASSIIYFLYQKVNPDAPSLREAILHPQKPLSIFTLLYLVSSCIQEFMARGVAQSSLQKFLNDQKGYKTVFYISLIFGIFHMSKGLDAAGASFIGSLILGLIYLRHQNLLGVSLVHYTSGILLINYLAII